MEPRARIDLFGATALVGFSLLLASNQVVIKLVNDGFQPVFFAAIRSVGAALVVALFIHLRGGTVAIARPYWGLALAMGACFAVEFIGLFIALDLTTVTRSSVIFYTMPVWLALGAHFVLPDDRITPVKATGLVLAFAGAAVAIFFREGNGADAGPEGGLSLVGDLCALLGAWGWASLVLIARGTRFKEIPPQVQHFWQLAVSAPILLVAAFFFGPFVRELVAGHLWGLAFQIVLIAGFGFMFWIWLLSIYPASGVASFSFLSPIFGILAGWLLLGEDIGPSTLLAGALVAVGLILINRPAKRAARPPI